MVSLPGVVAVAFVADGLPVFQQGKTDFEHIAAATEDIMRTGARIAGELQLGTAEQIIIETQGYKVIIAPVSDMFLCVLARAETNLGLIRLNIRSTQITCKS
jgi:predicted regulator of Ras-like GTPase activity (Roadblock/LC7/MglB family)